MRRRDGPGVSRSRGKTALAPVGIVAVAIDLGRVASPGIEEIEGQIQRARIFIGDGAEIPVLAAAILARDRHVVADLAASTRVSAQSVGTSRMNRKAPGCFA